MNSSCLSVMVFPLTHCPKQIGLLFRLLTKGLPKSQPQVLISRVLSMTSLIKTRRKVKNPLCAKVTIRVGCTDVVLVCLSLPFTSHVSQVRNFVLSLKVLNPRELDTELKASISNRHSELSAHKYSRLNYKPQ